VSDPGGLRPGRRRIALGVVLLVLSVLPWIAAPFVPLLGLPAGRLAGVVGMLLLSAEVIGALAVLVLGREAYEQIKSRLKSRRGESTQEARNE
jgi:hypothetical protein